MSRLRSAWTTIWRNKVINYAVRARKGATAYLELGCHDRKINFDYIESDYKVGVDTYIYSGADYIMEYADFFRVNSEKFDFILIDNEYNESDVYMQIMESSKILEDGGIIFVRGVCPTTHMHTYTKILKQVNGHRKYCGTAYKGYYKAVYELKAVGFNAFSFAPNKGLGMIVKGRIPIMGAEGGSGISVQRATTYRDNTPRLVTYNGYKYIIDVIYGKRQ